MTLPDRLTALDTSFLHLEGPTTPMHISSLATYDGPELSLGELRDALDRRLHLVPRFRQRLAGVPMSQHRPVWVDDPEFDLDAHLHHIRLPLPGTRDQLTELAGDLLSVPLDRSRPLWEMQLIDGLEDGGFAILSKTHHALWDGVGGADLHSVLLDTSPRAKDPEPPPWQPQPPPTPAQLLADGVRSRLLEPVRAARRALRSVTGHPQELVAESKQVLQGATAFAGATLQSAPDCPLNASTGRRRRYAVASCGLEELREIGHSHGATINDVVLAVTAGALRAWMIHRYIAPYDLRVMVPVSVRRSADRGSPGNRVAMVVVRLPVGEADPIRRLERVHSTMEAERQGGQARASEATTQLAAFAPPALVATLTRLQSRRWFNLLVTNVPGPRFPLYVRGRRLRELYPQAPLASSQGLNVAAMSYNGSMHFGLLADREAVGDLDVVSDALEDAIASLARTAAIKSNPADHPAHDPTADAPPAEVLVGSELQGSSGEASVVPSSHEI